MSGEARNLVFRDVGKGNLKSQNLLRKKEVDLELVAGVRKRRFQGGGDKFCLVSEVEWIRHAYLFDPYLPVCNSAIDPLPHQISDDATARVVLENSRSLKVDSPQIY